MKKMQKILTKEQYLVVYIDLSLSNAYQSGKFTRKSVIELLYEEIIKECKKFGLTALDKKIEKFIIVLY